MDRAVSWLTTSRPLFISWLNIYNQSRVAICEVLRLCIYLTDAFEARILQTPVSQSAYFATQLITILVYCGREVQPMNSPIDGSFPLPTYSIVKLFVCRTLSHLGQIDNILYPYFMT